MFSERLKEERERLALKQKAFADLCGVQRNAQIKYESGERKPTSEYLEKAAFAGVDVLYLLTGKRTDKGQAMLDKLNRAIVQASNEVEKARLIIAREDEIAKQVIRRENKIIREAEVENYRNLLYEVDDKTFESLKTMLNEMLGQSLLKERLENFKEKSSDNERRHDADKANGKGQNITADKINNVMGDNASVTQGNVDF